MNAEQWTCYGQLFTQGKVQSRGGWKLSCYVFAVERVRVKWRGRFFGRKT